MDFGEILKRVDRDLYEGLGKTNVAKLAKLLERSKEGLLPLLRQEHPALRDIPSPLVFRLGQAFEHYQRWRTAFRDAKRQLAQERLTLPDNALPGTAHPHELEALVRIARICPRSLFTDMESWTTAVTAHLALWNKLVAVCMEAASVTTEPTVADMPEAHAQSVVSGVAISELRGHRWMRLRQAQQAKVLTVSIAIPKDRCLEEIVTALPSLGRTAEKYTPDALLAELDGGALARTVESLLDAEAQNTSMDATRQAYIDLLSMPPLREDAILAVYVGAPHTPMGMAVLSKTGDVQETTEVAPDAEWRSTFDRLVNAYMVTGYVLPVSAPDLDRLNAVAAVIDDGVRKVVRVHTGGLRKAREQLSLPQPAAAAAVVLGRRANRPLSEWAKIPAADIGLGEYSSLIDPDHLQLAFEEARSAVRMAKKFKTPLSATQVPTKKRRPNPMVRSIRDLRPGMMVEGVVTNITRFGAFVNIGLSVEAMIHVSQLSEEFIEEPSQVVSVGQVVHARVLDVIPAKGRIALSLKSQDAPGASRPTAVQTSQAKAAAEALFSPDELAKLRSAAETFKSGAARPAPPPKADKSGRPDPPKKSRKEALAELDALFKK